MWKPASQEEILEMIDNAEWLMKPEVKFFWDGIKTVPLKWQQSPWGDEGGGFWVVAVFGQTCIYYNDIEDGFNNSSYERFGQIQNYGCNQTDLLSTVNSLYSQFCGRSK